MENIIKLCVLCQSEEKNELKYGKFYVKDGIAVHYFCLLLTSNLNQGGKDDDGILGFLPKDIKEESERIQSQNCCYCQKNGANIGCCQNKCRRIFHLICGIEHGAQNQFFETFRSFCDKDIYKTLRKHPPYGETCTICYEKFANKELFTLALCAPCCKNGWFHKWCLQEFANKAGYFFKCPLCNDNTKFVEQLPSLGIFIPKKDADWELEANAFEDLLERPNVCSATSCRCESGRKFIDKNQFCFIFCYLCGCKAIHKLCKIDNSQEKNEVYKCLECVEILNNVTNNTRVNEIEIYKSSNEDEIINIEDVDESECDIMDGTVKLPLLKINCKNQDLIKNINNQFNKPVKRSPSPKTPGTSGFHTLKRLDKPKFILTTVDPSIEKSVKKAFEKFESKVKQLFQKKSEMNSTSSECSYSSSNSETKGYLENQSNDFRKTATKLNFPFNKFNKKCAIVLPKNIKQLDADNVRIVSDRSKITNHFRKRQYTTTSNNSTSDSAKIPYHKKKQLKLSNGNKDNLGDSEIENSKDVDEICSNTNNFKNISSLGSSCSNNNFVTISSSNKKKENMNVNNRNINLLETNCKKKNQIELIQSNRTDHRTRLPSKDKIPYSSNDAKSDINKCRYNTRSKSVVQNFCNQTKSHNESKFSIQNYTNFKKHLPESVNSASDSKIIQTDKNFERESSISPTNQYYYLHNSRILRQNAKNKLSPINRKIQSNKYKKK